MKKYIKNIALNFGYKISKTVNPSKLNNFFAKINPIKTEHELIRIGGMGDGGYLIPDDLINLSYCFSPGVSNIVGFELDMASRGVKSYMIDYSVDSPPVENSLFHFEKKYLGVKDDEIFTTLDAWVNKYAASECENLLQMDIESAEYQVILDAPVEVIKKFRIIVVEFHDLHLLFDGAGFDLIDLTFNKLLKYFEIVHIHPNNCTPAIKYKGYEIPPVMEFTFLRKDRIKDKQVGITTFPHEMDVKNVKNIPDIVLPKCWQSK